MPNSLQQNHHNRALRATPWPKQSPLCVLQGFCNTTVTAAAVVAAYDNAAADIQLIDMCAIPLLLTAVLHPAALAYAVMPVMLCQRAHSWYIRRVHCCNFPRKREKSEATLTSAVGCWQLFLLLLASIAIAGHSPPHDAAHSSGAGCCVGRMPNLFLHVIRSRENLSSGEKRAG